MAGRDALSDADAGSGSCSSSDSGSDASWDGWNENRPATSLFDDTRHPTAAAALAHDAKVHGFDLDAVSKGLDFLKRIRLVNYIRSEHVSPEDARAIPRGAPLFGDDRYLQPVLEDDPLLELGEWSDSEEENNNAATLQQQLAVARQSLGEFRELIAARLDRLTLDAGPVPAPKPRDDDTHYFRSYSDNEIHSVMIQDTVRTSTYASFILSNPGIFEDAIVLDVGCGTGILSLFAARAGAKHVYAVDASDIVEKASRIVAANGLQDVITVIRGKVEDIVLPVAKVDVIISEWMGYALLYESMLDSVLRARDRFLRPGGLVAPSESRMQLALCDPADVRKERIEFWEDVYGFDMSVMSKEIYGEAVMDVVPEESMLSAPTVIKTINACTSTPKNLDFIAPFTLTSSSAKRTKAHAFLLYFDIIFNTSPQLVSEDFEVQLVKPGEGKVAEVWPIGRGRGMKRRASSKSAVAINKDVVNGGVEGGQSQGRVTSFSTGPMSIPTHWKQTIFLLKEPIPLQEGTVVKGQFYCKKSADNSRELDVEIHYSVVGPGPLPEKDGELQIQMYKVC